MTPEQIQAFVQQTMATHARRTLSPFRQQQRLPLPPQQPPTVTADALLNDMVSRAIDQGFPIDVLRESPDLRSLFLTRAANVRIPPASANAAWEAFATGG